MPTGAGSFHYIEKQVCLGLQAIKELEQSDRVNQEDIPLRRVRRSKSENNLAINRIDESYNQLPLRGEIRHVQLDMAWTRFGFRLQV